MKQLFLLFAMGSSLVFANQCLENVTNGELLNEVSKRMSTEGGGGGSSLEINMVCQCGNDGASDTYEIWVTGRESADEVRKKAKKLCKWSTFKACRYVSPFGPGAQVINCQCGKTGASDSYQVSGIGRTLGESYQDALSQCKWKPVLKACKPG